MNFCRTNQLSGFYMIATLAFNELSFSSFLRLYEHSTNSKTPSMIPGAKFVFSLKISVAGSWRFLSWIRHKLAFSRSWSKGRIMIFGDDCQCFFMYAIYVMVYDLKHHSKHHFLILSGDYNPQRSFYQVKVKFLN